MRFESNRRFNSPLSSNGLVDSMNQELAVYPFIHKLVLDRSYSINQWTSTSYVISIV